jgi:hypothetical protein
MQIHSASCASLMLGVLGGSREHFRARHGSRSRLFRIAPRLGGAHFCGSSLCSCGSMRMPCQHANAWMTGKERPAAHARTSRAPTSANFSSLVTLPPAASCRVASHRRARRQRRSRPSRAPASRVIASGASVAQPQSRAFIACACDGIAAFQQLAACKRLADAAEPRDFTRHAPEQQCP